MGKGAIQDGCSRGCGGSCASYVPPPFTVSASSLVVDCGGGGGWGGGGAVEAAMQGQGVWWYMCATFCYFPHLVLIPQYCPDQYVPHNIASLYAASSLGSCFIAAPSTFFILPLTRIGTELLAECVVQLRWDTWSCGMLALLVATHLVRMPK